jgi:hypothetical protein
MDPITRYKPGRGRLASIAAAVAIACLITACGGSGASADTSLPTQPAEATADATRAGQTADAAAPSASDSMASDDAGPVAGGCSLDAPASCGGSATLVIGGETIEFDFFACYTGDDAVVATRSDSGTFASIGQVSRNGATATVGFTIVERLGVPIYELVYAGGDSNANWHGVDENDQMTVEGGSVSFEGDFAETIDSEPTGQTQSGSLKATCG